MTSHPAAPPPAAHGWLITAGGSWIAAASVSLGVPGLVVAVSVVFLAATRGHHHASLLIAAVAVSGLAGAGEPPPVPEGPIDATGVMVTDVVSGRFGPWALVETGDETLLLDLPGQTDAELGDMVAFRGMADGRAGTIRGRSHGGTVDVARFEVTAGPSSPFISLGNQVRLRVLDRLAPLSPRGALLPGFLVGDISGLDPLDVEAMRRAGLSHFTAVSGSNVALFLGLLFLVSGPIGLNPRRRSLIGLIALPVYAAATRFEPSVMRATVMAGVMLGGRLLGLAFEAWQLLALAVVGLLLLDPGLAWNVGLQLSVVATAGVLVGSRWPLQGGRLARAFAVTLGAQIAVGPLLILHFGTVPLVSPILNVVAAPVVGLATGLASVGVAGMGPLLPVAAWLADLVLELARGAAFWPQVSWPGFLLVTGALMLALRKPGARGWVAVAGAASIVVVVLGPTEAVTGQALTVLDVGQGDALLLADDGRFVLVDGGPDPVVLLDKLHRRGVRRLDLVVLSHVHADHAGGLLGLVGRIPIERVWASTAPHETSAWRDLLAALESRGIPVESPDVGQTFRLGGLELVVEGPRRRYASPNDQSIVLLVSGPRRSALLAGDIEVVAQRELRDLRADILKVPHQGAATSDPGWLASVEAEIAVVSVGPNDFGHPAPSVIEMLEASGATVFRTDMDGDVVLELD